MARGGKKRVRVTGDYYHESTNAYGMLVDGDQVWFPKSLTHLFSRKGGLSTECSIEIDQWLAEDKGVDYEELS